jgi:threonine dehydrogenase-like Zn-dependent dehydrogenase
MKAFGVFPASRRYGVVECPDPAPPGRGEVVLEMLDVGICGTDREIASFEYGTPPAGSEYLVLGHESLGRVVECGAGVERVKAGDLVVPTVRRPCPHAHCRSCREGRQDFCFTGDFTERGIQGRHGFLARHVVEEERYLSVLDPHLREVGVLVEPLTIAEKAMKQMWQIQERLPWANTDFHCAEPGKGHEALVLGAGPVGLLGALKLVALGFETFVYSRLQGMEKKRALVESVGARFIAAEEVAVERIHDHIPQIDVVYEAVGASRLAFDMLRHLDTNGVFIFTGVPGRRGKTEIDSDALMRNLVLRNQIVFGTVNAGLDAFAEAAADLALFERRWPGALRGLITERLPLEETGEVLSGRIHGIKSVVQLAA